MNNPFNLTNVLVRKPPSRGQLLLSEPFQADGTFKRAVVLLCEHSDTGSLGFMLHRPLTVSLGDVLELEGKVKSLGISLGGPVAHDTLHFIHSHAPLAEDGQEVLPGVWWGGDFSALTEAITSGALDPKDVRFFLGYSGWTAGQLQTELEAQTWIQLPANVDQIFSSKGEELWQNILEENGGGYRLLSHFPESPRLN